MCFLEILIYTYITDEVLIIGIVITELKLIDKRQQYYLEIIFTEVEIECEEKFNQMKYK